MELHQGIILGVLQGLTEFLPVSSSGHLVLGQAYFGMTQSQLVFDISVHLGTLLAVLVVYASDIAKILASTARFIFGFKGIQAAREAIAADEHLQLAGIIVIGSVPTAVIGFVLKEFEQFLFSSALLVGCMLLVTGSLLWVSRKYYSAPAGRTSLSVRQGIIIGISQGLAVIPGISRSGTTIATGMFLGLDRRKAATFSFLLSIPAIIGAQILSVKDMLEKGVLIEPVTLWATVVSFITGLIALKLLIKLVHAGRFHLFAPYCWLLGAITIILQLI